MAFPASVCVCVCCLLCRDGCPLGFEAPVIVARGQCVGPQHGPFRIVWQCVWRGFSCGGASAILLRKQTLRSSTRLRHVCEFCDVRTRSLQQCALLYVLWFLRCCTWLWPSSLPPSTARALPASIWAPVILAQRPRYPVARATGAVRGATRTGSQFLGQGRSVCGGRRSASKWIGNGTCI